ncbi:glycosaminoglycan xylosylkinase-like [Glandiceps talaboti]
MSLIMKLKQKLVIVFFACVMAVVWMILSLDSNEAIASNVQMSIQQRHAQPHFEKILVEDDDGNMFIPDLNANVVGGKRRLDRDLNFPDSEDEVEDHGFENIEDIWRLAEGWVKSREIYPPIAPDLGTVLHAMATAKITRADVGYKGTQLKAMLTLEGGQHVVFKPMRYPRDHIISGSPYGGYDRHNAEIAAFHLDRILGLRRAPLVVGRYINLQTEILPVASSRLKETFFLDSENNTCFYGVCHYCNKGEPACGKDAMIEGSVTLWLPTSWPLQKSNHPWQRTYKEGKKARWEYDNSYCQDVVQRVPYNSGPRFLDIIDTSVLDFLIGNADRHHYETFKQDGNDAMLLNLDNAKSFGNAFHDEKSILAPIFQCCKIRSSTWQKLQTLKSGTLSSLLRQALSHDPVSPVLSELHYESLDRRLRAILTEVDKCFKSKGHNQVLVNGYVL